MINSIETPPSVSANSRARGLPGAVGGQPPAVHSPSAEILLSRIPDAARITAPGLFGFCSSYGVDAEPMNRHLSVCSSWLIHSEPCRAEPLPKNIFFRGDLQKTANPSTHQPIEPHQYNERARARAREGPGRNRRIRFRPFQLRRIRIPLISNSIEFVFRSFPFPSNSFAVRVQRYPRHDERTATGSPLAKRHGPDGLIPARRHDGRISGAAWI